MRLRYHSDTDSLYIDLAERESVDSIEVSPGVVVDYDAEGRIVGLDIDHASRTVSLSSLVTQALPLENVSLSA